MSTSAARKQREQTAKKTETKVSSPTVKSLNKFIRSIDEIYETNDRKLQEIVEFCMDKKCNE